MSPPQTDPDSAAVAAAQAGDEAAFAALVARYRRELHVHCYRMLGSLDDADDMLQETFLRAWRRRETFAGRASFRAWLYRIATNACLDQLARRPRRPSADEIPWLQPYPDRLLEAPAPSEDEPEAVVVDRETIELAFMVAVQHVPPRPRAVLILRDVLGWPAKETAELLGMSVAAVNSALQRARGTLQERLPAHRAEWAAGGEPTAAERELVQRYVDASERGDAEALAAMLRDDAIFTMPPQPGLWRGRETIVRTWLEGGFGTDSLGDFRCLVTAANRQPTVANYTRRPGESEYRALALDVLDIVDGEIAAITTFGPSSFPAFDLPPKL